MGGTVLQLVGRNRVFVLARHWECETSSTSVAAAAQLPVDRLKKEEETMVAADTGCCWFREL
jgi:hypothetical protein